MKFLAVALFALLAVASGEIIDGECPEVHGVENFDLERYAGLWYEVSRFELEAEYNADCVTFQYDVTSGGFDYETSFLVLDAEPLERQFFPGQGVLADASGLGRINKTRGDYDPAETNWVVASTDYENYAIIFNCYAFLEDFSNQFFWVLSRTPELNPEIVDEIDDFVENTIGLDHEYLRFTNQDDDSCLGWE